MVDTMKHKLNLVQQGTNVCLIIFMSNMMVRDVIILQQKMFNACLGKVKVAKMVRVLELD